MSTDSNPIDQALAEALAGPVRYRSPSRAEARDARAGELVQPVAPSRRKELHHARTRNRKARARIYLAPFSYHFRP